MAERGPGGSGLTWFVRRGSTVRGPYSSTRVRHYVLEGRLQLDDEVSVDRKAWRRIGAVDEVVPLQMRDGEDAVNARNVVLRSGEKRRALRSMLISGAVVSAVIALVLLSGGPETEAPRDCSSGLRPGVLLEGCDLSGRDLRAALLADAGLANARLGGAVLAEADLRRADLRYVDLSSSDLSYAQLDRAVLKGASLRGADLTNANLGDADLTFVDLTGARVGGAVWHGADLNGAVWVDGGRCGERPCPR